MQCHLIQTMSVHCLRPFKTSIWFMFSYSFFIFSKFFSLKLSSFFFFLLIIIILQELLVKSHQLPLNKTKNERSLMAMQCKDPNNLVDSVFLCVHKDCSFVRTEDTDAIYTTLFLQNICCLWLAQILWIIHHNHFHQLVLNKSGLGKVCNMWKMTSILLHNCQKMALFIGV